MIITFRDKEVIDETDASNENSVLDEINTFAEGEEEEQQEEDEDREFI